MLRQGLTVWFVKFNHGKVFGILANCKRKTSAVTTDISSFMDFRFNGSDEIAS